MKLFQIDVIYVFDDTVFSLKMIDNKEENNLM
jgi:hypothetical protein